jgi:hypothetical protein
MVGRNHTARTRAPQQRWAPSSGHVMSDGNDQSPKRWAGASAVPHRARTHPRPKRLQRCDTRAQRRQRRLHRRISALEGAEVEARSRGPSA